MKLPKFSARTAWDDAASPLAEAVREAALAGRPLLDLTLSNPTRCRFQYDTATTLQALTDPAAMQYEPDPRGLPSAREAVRYYYWEHGAQLSPDDIVLTTSTSEAYSFLFRLLCDPGDEVLVAQPSYPLFDFLATLDDVVLKPYPLFFDFGWWIDLAELERRITARTRAILLVHPNNPTGHLTGPDERRHLEELCVRYGLSLVVDEVFLDYTLEADCPAESFGRGPHPALTFVLSGLSKLAALPQMKVGWIAAFGPDPVRHAALARLEIIADTFLSLNAPVQFALPAWLAGREVVVEQIRARARQILALWHEHGFTPLPTEAGWSTIVRLPAWVEARPEALVRSCGVVVHAGEFYGLTGAGWIVVSLIVPSDVCREALERLRQEVDRLHPA